MSNKRILKIGFLTEFCVVCLPSFIDDSNDLKCQTGTTDFIAHNVFIVIETLFFEVLSLETFDFIILLDR